MTVKYGKIYVKDSQGNPIQFIPEGTVHRDTISSVASEIISSGGYATTSEVEAIVTDHISSGGYVTSSGTVASAGVANGLTATADSEYVHINGTETISGGKTFTSGITVSDSAIISGNNEAVQVSGAGNTALSTSNTSSLRHIDLRTQNNGNAGIWDFDNNRWMIHATNGGVTEIVSGLKVIGDVTATTFSGTATTATNATSLGGSAASVYEKVGHTHSYLPLAGGTLSGSLTISRVNPYLFFVETDWSKGTPQTSGTSYQGIYFSGSNAEGGHITYHYETDKDAYMQIAVQNLATASATGTTYVNMTYLHGGEKQFYPGTNNDTNLGLSDHKWKNVYATTFSGALAGNATTATTATNYISGTASAAIAGIGGNGKTVRFPGGLQICYGSGSLASSGTKITFGSAFAETPSIHLTARPASAPTVTHCGTVVGASTTSATLYFTDGSTLRGGNYYYTAIGKWK